MTNFCKYLTNFCKYLTNFCKILKILSIFAAKLF